MSAIDIPVARALSRPPVEEFTVDLSLNAHRYFPELEGTPVEVRLTSSVVRPFSYLYKFELTGNGTTRMVIVKTPRRDGELGDGGLEHAADDRPRIVAFADPRQKVGLEYAALSKLDEYFTSLNDLRFGAVRVLAMPVDGRALMMEFIDHPNLRQLVLRHRIWRSAKAVAELAEAFRHAGAWLRAYHSFAETDDVRSVHSQRRDFVRFSSELSLYLAKATAEHRFLEVVNTKLRDRAREVLPQALPSGLMHGDFAMRNVLVGPRRRVTVLDTAARFRTAIYRDIGSFLSNLDLSTLPALARGSILLPLCIPTYRRAFVEGYFDDGHCPHPAIQLYEVQALLERWSSFVWRSTKHGNRRGRMTKRLQLPVANALFRRLIELRLASADRDPCPA